MTLRNASELPQYAEMKDSGVAWLGKIPSHWKVLPNRILFEEVKERDHPEEQMLSVTIKRGVIRQNELLDGSSQKDSSNLDKSAYKQVKPGDIAYNKMRAWQGAVGVSEYQGIVSPAYVVERPRNRVSSNFFHFLLRTPGFAKEAERWSYGITSDMWSLRPEHFKMIYSCLPPLPEQIAIVHFLDHADRRIRRYIRAKQKLIALLEEQRQAIIHQAVTGQIDVRTDQPYPAYKASGVKSLGPVPGHWEVQQLGRFGQFFKGAGGTKDDEVEHGVPCVRYGDLYTTHEFFVTNSRAYVTEERAAAYAPIRYGDVLFAGSGETIDEIGKSAVNLLSTHACCGGDIIVFRPCIGCNAKFLGYAADSWAASNQKSTMGRGITVMHIYGTSLKYVRVVLPPVPEQTSIVGFLDRFAEEVKRATAQTQSEIDLLREYRTRLIADVVTGKLDVREAAAELPEDDVQDDADESEAEYTSEHPTM